LRRTPYPFAIVAIAIGALAAFGAVPRFDFVDWDDGLHVYKNPGVAAPSVAAIARFWRAPYEYLYMPVTYTAWAALSPVARLPRPDARGTTLNPAVFHTANLVTHALSALILFHVLLVLLWVEARREGREPVSRGPPDARTVAAAGFGALVFAVHPLQAEAVAWVTGFKDVLSALFGLAALFHLLVYAARQRGGVSRVAFAAESGIPRALLFQRVAMHYGASLVLLALALLSKPAAVALPFMAAALVALMPSMSLRREIRYVGPWLVLAAPVALLARHIQGPTTQVVVPLAARPVIAGDAIAFYLAKLIAPSRLSPIYDHAPSVALARPHVAWIATLPLLLGAVLAYFGWRRRSPYIHLYAAFIAALVPVLGFVPFLYQQYSTVADHYAYLAMAAAGAAAAFATAAAMRLAQTAIVVTVTVMLIASACVVANVQASRWRTSVVLLDYALSTRPANSPGNAKIYFNLGNVKMREGKLPEAVELFHRSIALDPSLARVRNNLGTIYAQQGDLTGATREFAEAVRLDSTFAEAHNNLGQALAIQGRMAEAIVHFRRAVALAPTLADARANLDEALREAK